MAINKIKVDTDYLSNDAVSVGESVSAIEQSLSKLIEQYGVLDTMWDGPASEVFRFAYQDDIEALKTLIGNLKQFNSFEVNAKDKYNTCEKEVDGIISSLSW